MSEISNRIVKIWSARDPREVLAHFCFEVDQNQVGLTCGNVPGERSGGFGETKISLDVYDSKSGQLVQEEMKLSYCNFFKEYKFRPLSKKEVLSEIPQESPLAHRILSYFYA